MSTKIGDVSEEFVLRLVRGIKIVKKAWRDHFNSKFDILCVIHDNTLRGIEVKTLGLKRGTNSDFWFNANRLPSFITDLPHPYNKKGDGPEGPEIKHFAKKLSKICSGELLKKLTILRGPYTTNSKDRYLTFREKVNSFQPHTVDFAGHKGKWLYFRLKGPQYVALGVHHGMEGSWCTAPENKHNILELKLSSKTIYFQDSRRFGTFSLLTESEFEEAIDRLGDDVFSVKLKDFQEAFKTKRIQKHQLCDVLLDQKIVSGIGNYMRADIMYLARLNPKELIKDLSEDQIKLLHSACRKIAWNSFEASATTCGSYESAIHRGHYDPLVYGKKRCPKGHAVETFKSKGRTVHWVPKILGGQ